MAAARYKKLAEFNDVLYTMDSPVVIEKMVHCYDSLYGVNVLQITFRNVSGSNLYGLSLGIELVDNRGNKVKTIDFNYYAIEIPHGKTFGSNEDIMVEPEAVKFYVQVKGADLENGYRFKDKLSMDRMPNPIPLSFYTGTYEEKFTKRFEELYPKARLICAPERKPDYWRCTCGRIWPHDALKCTVCKIKKDDILGLLPKIKKEEQARLEAERAAAEEKAYLAAEEARIIEEAHKKAEEERERAERQRLEEEALASKEAEAKAAAEAAARKKRLRNSGVIAAVCALVCLFAFYVIPEARSYHEHRAELANASESAITISDKNSGDGDDKGKGEVKKPDLDTPFMVMGEGINSSNEDTMWRLLGSSESISSEYDKMDVSTNEGHIYMDGVIGRSNVEKSAVSGVIVRPRSGGGLNVKMYNIDYYTEDDFREQIQSMGIDNADVVVAAPVDSSGSTAMLGLLKFACQTDSMAGKAIGTAVAKDNMNVRTGNNIQAHRLTTIPKGTELEVLEVMSNSWYKIIWPSSEVGYAYTSNYKGMYYDFTFKDK